MRTGPGEGGRFILEYVGTAMMDRRCQYSKEMIPWILAEILRFSGSTQVVLSVLIEGRVMCTALGTGQMVFDSENADIVHSFNVDLGGRNGFVLIIKANEIYFHCRLFVGSSGAQVSEVFSSLETSSSVEKCASAPSPISPDAVSFECEYVGKLRLSYRKAPSTFIDEAVEKLKLHEGSRRSSRESSESFNSFSGSKPVFTFTSEDQPDHEERRDSTTSREVSPAIQTEKVVKASISHPLEDVTYNKERSRNPSGDLLLVKSQSLPVSTERMRGRALSTGHYPRETVIETNKIGGQYNRTMILIVAKSEIKIISPDRKSQLLSRSLREIYQISQGIERKDHIGFISKESVGNNGAGSGSSSSSRIYVAYIFRTESQSVAEEILKVLKQASFVANSEPSRSASCFHCPMVWYRDLCSEIVNLSPERVQLVILKHLSSLSESERASILEKFGGAEGQGLTEQNELLMMLLRVHCEAKQIRHVHDTAENRHEFLAQFLGGGEILSKARRSIDSFMGKRRSPLSPLVSLGEDGEEGGGQRGRSGSRVMSDEVSDSPLAEGRRRSSTMGALTGAGIKFRKERKAERKGSPALNLFQRMGSVSTPSQIQTPSSSSAGSWRHAIFRKVVSPSTPNTPQGGQRTNRSSKPNKALFAPKSQGELRELWRRAIQQQILLIRMEKQNLLVKAKLDAAHLKQTKLHYQALGTCDEESSETWDLIMAQASSKKKCDIDLLNSALLRGLPKHKRGQVWLFFMQQRTEPDASDLGLRFPDIRLDLSYDQLLQQLTSQQHAILIDLGRTYPTHPYFSGALGSGQLALFNILKAYSLLDPEVGYCQGLSFLAGLLLMHLEEEEAFELLKYIMFGLNARQLYMPEMGELQVKLYQLTRLIHDSDPDLLVLLNHYDVLPSLYAAPWFLTLFASQFPIGFAVRVVDLLLLHGLDVITKMALLLVLDNRKELMACSGLEQMMDCFKTTVTKIDSDKLDKYFRKVLESSWDRQLLTYAVEYGVLREEAAQFPEKDAAKRVDRGCQTSLEAETKHPIFGDLIERQEREIERLKLEKLELRRDLSALLGALSNMQRLMEVATDGKVIPLPPDVMEIGEKYSQRGEKYGRGSLAKGLSMPTGGG